MLTKWLQIYTQNEMVESKRLKTGLLAGVVGLISNLILFIIKLLAGWLSGSVSIMTDAVNSLSDTASSIMTLLGFQIASKPADKEHPYGHQRFEYISGLIMSIIIIFVGLQFLRTSIVRIFNPSDLGFGSIIFILLIVSILIKFIQFFFYRAAATFIHSNTLRVAAQDSLNDIYTTLIVIASSLVEIIFGWQIDGYTGALLAIFIVYSGIQIIRDSMNDLLGIRPSPKELAEIIHHFEQFDEMMIGYHDLLVHNYGPNKTYASIHIEVDESWDLKRAHAITDKLEKHFKNELGIDLVCHLDPIAVQNENHTGIYRKVKRILNSYQLNLKFHDFKVDDLPTHQKITFDLVLPEKITTDTQLLLTIIKRDIFKEIGPCEVDITLDYHNLLDSK
ncbi:Ferrous-iron efflux pump FieF [Jeotgalibaca dankookensis]|uniref:Ferrous-iron efflux pump FieF n=1 Tax=Jeotgalibaca dankookensis TaxID=708126 RepID=A0A1S6IRJ7_9LACT|nr:cation diffusion facilitator family transporter [Jeotgalibaca dankookensis]AQS54100.1 Ferrous-iron efflux pump FieF [Jeotgalibaca dankookensis]